MALHCQSVPTRVLPSISFFSNCSGPSRYVHIPIRRTHLNHLKTGPPPPHSFRAPRCLVSVVSEPAPLQLSSEYRPLPAEISRTIMELSSVGTLSALTQGGSPLGIGVHFAVDPEGTPILSLNSLGWDFSSDWSSTLHVQLEQCGLRTTQCTIQGVLDKPDDKLVLKRLNSIWKKRFGEEVDEGLLYVVSVERVLQIEDFMEDGIWVSSLDYKRAIPDPLRDVAENIVDEINTHNVEDVYRFCNIYVDLDFQVKEAKMVWVDRLGFDMRLRSPENDVLEVRIPFPREVTDEKGAKSSFNGMSQLAWEVEKNCQVPNFKKVKQFKKIKYRSQWM